MLSKLELKARQELRLMVQKLGKATDKAATTAVSVGSISKECVKSWNYIAAALKGKGRFIGRGEYIRIVFFKSIF